jgi:Double-stranded RNA binding motif
MSTANYRPLEFVAHPGPQNLRALTGNAVINVTITGTGTLQSAAQQLPSPVSQPDRTRYTSLLKEYGDNAGERPVYYEDELGNSGNPLFRCEVRFQGVAAVAEAQSKKLARADASYMVCQQLGI